MSRFVIVLFFFAIFSAVFLADRLPRPVAPLQPVVLPSSPDRPQTYPQGVMMAVNAQGKPVFGFPDPMPVPQMLRAVAMPVTDVDAAYPEVPAPQLGPLQAVMIGECAVQMSLQPLPLAMVTLSLTAPCQPQSRFVVGHGAISFATVTDSAGKAHMTVPALASPARFSVFQDNLEMVVGTVIVPDKRGYDRVAVHWTTQEDIALHAFSPTASDAVASGAVDAGQSKSVMEDRGYLFALRDNAEERPVHLKVFTFPAGYRASSGGIILALSNLLNPHNCGREIDMVVVESLAGAPPRATPVSPRMPGCSQIGHDVFLTTNLDRLLDQSR